MGRYKIVIGHALLISLLGAVVFIDYAGMAVTQQIIVDKGLYLVEWVCD